MSWDTSTWTTATGASTNTWTTVTGASTKTNNGVYSHVTCPRCNASGMLDIYNMVVLKIICRNCNFVIVNRSGKK